MSDLPSYEDVLKMLAEKAKDGSVSAMTALERALRDERAHPLDDELERLIQRNDA